MSATITEVRKLPTDSFTDSEGKKTWTQPYLVKTQENNSTPWEVGHATHADLPNTGEGLGDDETIKVIHRNVTRAVGSDGKPAQNIWNVGIEYGIPTATSGPTGTGPSGDTNNAKLIRFTIAGRKVTLYTQQPRGGGHAVLNSAGDIYPDPQEVTDNDEQITIEFESDTFDPAKAEAARNEINDASITLTLPQGTKTWTQTFAAYTLLLDDADYEIGVSRVDNTNHTYRVRLVLLYRKDTWMASLPDVGYRTSDEKSAKPNFYRDSRIYLDGSGSELAGGVAVVACDETFQRYTDSGDLATLLTSLF